MPGDDWKPTVPERPSSRDAETVIGDARSAPKRDPSPATPSQRYVGVEEIARGGMGRVIEATDTLLARTVAVKEALTNDPETLKRFARETRITARLEHPSIVPVYDAGTDPENPFYVMRRVSGRPLSGLISAASSLDERLALIPHLLACAQAIAHAHKRGVIHRDIKPNNILVGELGETVVIDWGIAKVIGESEAEVDHPPLAEDSLRTRIGTVSGTPGFMSPEQARGDDLGPSADVWALGATLYYLLSRQMPHAVTAKTPDDLLALAAYRAVPPIASVISGVPPELAAITDRALAFDVEDRFPDAASLAEELSRFLTGQIVASHRYSVRERLVRWTKRHRAIVAIAVMAVAVVATVSTIAIRRVIAARERADAAALQAEAARARAQAHAEAELLARAREIATTRPTAAIAAIDLLPEASSRHREADAIFATAISHGGAVWGLAQSAGESTIALELDPTAAKLMQLSLAGRLRVWELDGRRLLVDRELPRGAHPVWSARGLLIFRDGGTKVVDLATGNLAPFGTSHDLVDIRVSEDGTRIAAVDRDKVAGWLDVATGEFRPVTTKLDVVHFVMSGDGSWMAIATKRELVAYDRSGAEMFRHPADVSDLAASQSTRLAYLEGEEIVEIDVGSSTTTRRPAHGVHFLDYHQELLVGRTTTKVYTFRASATAPTAVGEIDGISSLVYPLGSGVIMLSDSSKLFYFDRAHSVRIALPEPLTQPRLATRTGSWRAVIASNAGVFVVDLQYALPRRREDLKGNKAYFVTDDRVIEFARGTWSVQVGDKRVELSLPEIAEIVQTDGDRAVFSDVLQQSKLFVLNVSTLQTVEIEGQQATLLDGGLLYLSGNALYLRDDATATGREIAQLSNPTATTLVADGSRFWVLSSTEILRGDRVSGVVERERYVFPDDARAAVVNGRILFAHQKQLRWEAANGPVLATLEAAIVRIDPAPGGAILSLASGATVYVALNADGTASTHHLAPRGVTSSALGRLAVRLTAGTEMIEIPTLRRWLHPLRGEFTQVSMSPGGTKVLELGADFGWWEWTLPPARLEIAAIRETATNAREQSDRTLLWPWQTSR